MNVVLLFVEHNKTDAPNLIFFFFLVYFIFTSNSLKKLETKFLSNKQMHLELFNPIYAFNWYVKKGENFHIMTILVSKYGYTKITNWF
jgi:hypothetical protein